MSPDRKRGQAGYTLVELIIATAMGAIVLGAVTSIVLTTAVATNVATSRVDASNQVRTFQVTAYDDIALSSVPSPAGCGAPSQPCTTQAMVLAGLRLSNATPGVPSSGVPTAYSVTYTWNSTTGVVVRQVAGGPSRTVATNVTSYSWYVDRSGAYPAVVVNLTVTFNSYNSLHSQSQSLRFYPRVGS